MTTIVRAVLGYIFLTLAVRFLTRRPGAQMTLFEFVLVFLMGGVIIASTVGNDHSMTNCICAVITVALTHRIVSFAKVRLPRFRVWLDGTPLTLIRQGKWQQDILSGMRLAPEDVMASARTHGVRQAEEIDYAVLERNGGISLIRKPPDDQKG